MNGRQCSEEFLYSLESAKSSLEMFVETRKLHPQLRSKLEDVSRRVDVFGYDSIYKAKFIPHFLKLQDVKAIDILALLYIFTNRIGPKAVDHAFRHHDLRFKAQKALGCWLNDCGDLTEDDKGKLMLGKMQLKKFDASGELKVHSMVQEIEQETVCVTGEGFVIEAFQSREDAYIKALNWMLDDQWDGDLVLPYLEKSILVWKDSMRKLNSF